MARRNQAACTGECELVLAEGAGHGFSYLVDQEKCDGALEHFLNKYCKQKE